MPQKKLLLIDVAGIFIAMPRDKTYSIFTLLFCNHEDTGNIQKQHQAETKHFVGNMFIANGC